MTKLLDGIINQFTSLWEMIDQGIDKVPNQYFKKSENEFQYNFVIYHIIETIDFYMMQSPDTMNWGDAAGIDWEADNHEIKQQKDQISKEFLRSYKSRIKEQVELLFTKWDGQRILYQDEFEWFNSIHEKLVYTIRHTSYHLGELSKSLRMMNAERMTWE